MVDIISVLFLEPGGSMYPCVPRLEARNRGKVVFLALVGVLAERHQQVFAMYLTRACIPFHPGVKVMLAKERGGEAFSFRSLLASWLLLLFGFDRFVGVSIYPGLRS